ncbi:MAG: thiamine pyrophosphate-dependent dehydrogenase E1 component subunit alpha [Pseudomonadota bacterium]
MISNSPLAALYRDMRRIRTFEERVGEMFVREETAGSMLHLSIGEEAIAGVVRAMGPDDSFTTHHRGHGMFLARGADPARMLAEIGGRSAGYCGGKGGSMHIADMGLGHLGANAIVGGGIPHVVGAALAYRNRREPRVSLAVFGDGAMQQGVLYESMNMAALWRLPCLFVCINNQYGMGTRVDRASASTDFSARAKAFGLEAERADGTDAEAVHAAADRLLSAARVGRPGYLEIHCYRFHGHARMDRSPYRDAEEEEEGRKRDPVARAREALTARGEADAATLDAVDAAAEAEMDAALEAAIAEAPPSDAMLFTDVYGPSEPPPEPVARRLDRILNEARA